MSEQKTAPQWPITNEDKDQIRSLGRLLHKTVLNFAKENSVNGSFHAKIMSGAFQYVEYVFGTKAQLISDDLLYLQDAIERNGLGDKIVEPFQPTPAPSLEELKAEADKKLAEAQNEADAINQIINFRDKAEETQTEVEETPAAPEAPVVEEAPTE